jgi:nucleotide-binding universal stress UspA family protein
MYKHILLPTDGSDLSKQAIASALELAAAIGARVTVLCVVVDTPVAAGIGKAMRDKDEPVKAAEQDLAAIGKQATQKGVPHECYYVVAPWPHEEIVKAAQTKGCDLIFMASKGKGAIAGLFLGSEADKVAKHSMVPVLLHR